jgi:hypothetical protein
MTSFDRKTGRYQARSGTGNEKRAEGTLTSRTQFEGAMFRTG